MKKMQRLFLLLTFLGLFVLAACGGGEDVDLDPTLAATEAAEEPTEPPATDTPAPTDTPEPTNTPAPTNTPQPQPTATADALSGFAEFDNDALGVTLMYPEDWVTDFDEVGLEAQFASSRAVIDDPGSVEGASFNLIRMDAEMLSFFGENIDPEDPISVLEAFVELATAAQDEDVTVIGEPTSLTINGMDAASVDIEAEGDEVTGLGTFYTILSEGQVTFVVTLVGEDSEAELQPVLDAMLDSLDLRAADVEAITDVPTELPEAQGTLNAGESVEGSITAGEIVVWDFTGAAGDSYDITVEPSEDLDVIVNVFDATGASILDAEVDSAFGTEEITDVTLETSGDFHIAISGFGSSEGDYTLTLNEAGTSTTEPVEGGGAIAYGDTVQSSVEAGGAANWTFTAAAGDVLNIVVTPLDEDFDAVVDVLDASGASILPAGEVDNSFEVEQITGQVVVAAGEYTIVVHDYADSAGTFELTLDNASSGAAPTGDTIAYGESATGTLAGTETSTYTFFGTADELVDVTISPQTEGLDVIVDVLDSNGRSVLADGEIDKSFDTERVRILQLPESGAYTVAVRAYEGTGDYDLTVNLTNKGAVATVLQAFYNIDVDEETHTFPFNALAGDQVTAIVDPVEPETDVVLEIYDDDDNELIDSVDLTTGFEELTFEVTDPGNYYFLVKGFENSQGEYDIMLVGPESTQFVLASNDIINGRFMDNGLIEYWYDGVAGETVTFNLAPEADVDGVIRILDADGNVLAETDENLYGEAEELSYTFDAEDTILIEISDFFSGEGLFTFTVESDT